MSGTRRPLGKDFTPPDRTAGLRVMLSAAPSPPDYPETEANNDRAAETSAEPPREKDSDAPDHPDSGRLTLVVVYLSDSVYRALRERAAASSRSYTDLALDAIETRLNELSEHWKPAPTGGRGVLFQRRQSTRPRRDEPARQVQLRLHADSADTLRRLPREIGAPSTTALVDEALRRALLTGPSL